MKLLLSAIALVVSMTASIGAVADDYTIEVVPSDEEFQELCEANRTDSDNHNTFRRCDIAASVVVIENTSRERICFAVKDQLPITCIYVAKDFPMEIGENTTWYFAWIENRVDSIIVDPDKHMETIPYSNEDEIGF